MPTEIVRVQFSATHIDIDFRSSYENGLLNADEEGYNSGEMIAAVQQAVRAGNSLNDKDGNLVLIVGRPIAYTVLS